MKFPKKEQWLYLAHFMVSRYFFRFRGKEFKSQDKMRFVCVKWDEIGDMVTCVHAFRMLKAEYPNSHITVVCKPFVKSLLIAESSIDEIYTDLSDLTRIQSDIWIEFRGTFYSLFRAIISGSKLVLTRGFVRFAQRGNQQHERVTNARIIAPILSDGLKQILGLEINSRVALSSIQQFVGLDTSDEAKKLAEVKWDKNFKFALIHPGGRSLLRRWKPENYKQIQTYLFEKYGLHSLVLGSKEEESLVKELTQEPYTQAWISEDSLLVLLEVIKQAAIFIGNESGPLQIADLTVTPAVGLFGPGVPNVFYPSNPTSKVLHYILDCNPCDQVTCVRPDDRCVDRISFEEVKAAVDSILQKEGLVDNNN